MGFIGFLILLAAGFALFMYMRSAKKVKGAPGRGRLPGSDVKALPRKEATVLNLRVNDIFSWMGQDFLVEGKLTYRESGDVWWEHRLVDGGDVRWLGVEDDDELEVAMWQEIDLHVGEGGPPETLEWEGQSYRCVERGEARVTRDGKTGRKEGLSCRYWDYESSGDAMLCVERWGRSWEVSAGEPLSEGSYDILPGDLVEG